MAKWNEYGLKSGTSAEDEVLILDSDTNTNKRTTVGDIQEFVNGKILEKENSTLNTEAKDLIGAINEVDAKNDAQDKKIEEVENKFSNYLKKTDVDSTLSVSGSPADAKVVGDAVGSLKEDLGDLIYKYQENDGYVGYASGTIFNLNGIKCTDFLPIKKGMTVKVSGISFEPSDYRGLAIYDKNKIFKNGYQYNQNNEYTFDVIEDGYLRATIVGQQIKVIANQNGIAKALIEVSEDTQKEIKREVNTLILEEYGEEKQLEITETKEGYAVKSDGSKENAGWISSMKFNCAPYQKIYTKNAKTHENYP